ncbi:hypothetical protein CsSME_00013052 [Camellia sinensis var. sinensis]
MSGPDVFLPACPSMAASLLPRSTYPRLIFAPLFSLQRDLLLPSFDRLVHVSSPIAAFNRRFRAQNSNNSADATVVAGDENYGNKRVISVTPRLYDYLLSNVREPEILKELREETATRRDHQFPQEFKLLGNECNNVYQTMQRPLSRATYLVVKMQIDIHREKLNANGEQMQTQKLELRTFPNLSFDTMFGH